MGIPATLSSVPAQTPYIQYVATSGQTVFPYPFEITQDSDLVAVANGTTLATDSGYTLSGVGASTGGSLTFTSGRTAGDIITLYRDIPIERLTQFAQNGGFSSTAFNAEFNNVYLLLQQLQTSIDQCLQIPNTNNPAPTTSLTPGAYASKYLAFDSNGNPEPASLTSSGTLTGSILAGILASYTAAAVLPPNVKTAAETAANVTPVNYAYPPYHAFRYLSASQIADVQAGTLLVDCTTALNNWLAASAGQGVAVLPAGSYLISGQLTAKSGTRIVGAARGETIISYAGSSAITGGSMLAFSEGAGNICSAFSIECVQFECTDIVSTNTTVQLELLNPVYWEVRDCIFGGSNATANKLTGIYIHQDASTYTPPLGAGVLHSIEAVVEPPTAAVAGSYAVKIVGGSTEPMVNIMMSGEGAIEHFNKGVYLEYVNSSVLTNWEFRGASGVSGDTCIELVSASYNTIIAPTLAPAATYGTGISLDSGSTWNAVFNPGWNLSSGNPLAAYTDSGSYNSIVCPNNASSFTPVSKIVGSLLLAKADGTGPNLAIPRTTSDTTESGLQIYTDHTPTNEAFLLVDRGSGVGTQDLEWVGYNGTMARRVDYLGNTYIGAHGTALNQKLKGTATFSSATSVAVSLGVTLATSTYQVYLSGNAAGYCWVTSKGTTGFTINCSASNSNSVDWTVEV